ncbi:MAG: SEFIR domain-containing protein, partial [Acidobacteriota bacterium]
MSGSSARVRVFLSYSHDDNGHRRRVLQLGEQLRRDGVQLHMDRFERAAPADWNRWFWQQVVQADWVLVICTRGYRLRHEGKAHRLDGRGGRFDTVVMPDLYDAAVRATRFLPVLFDPSDRAYIPQRMREAGYTTVNTPEAYALLRERLQQAPRSAAPTARHVPARRGGGVTV